MKLAIGQTAHRKDPGGGITVVDINHRDDLKTHQALQAKGYEYVVIKDVDKHTGNQQVMNKNFVADFDLPEVAGPAVTTPKVHGTDSVCLACEG